MNHAARGMVTAWLALIVLQTVSTKGGSGRVAGLFGDLDGLVRRALDPTVPAIPDRRTGAGVTPESPYYRPPDMPVPGRSPVPTTIGRVGGTYGT